MAIAMQLAKQVEEKRRTNMKRRRVIVTGKGVVTPLDHEPDVSYNNLLEGVSGISEIENFDCASYPMLSMYNKTSNRRLAFITMASEEDATAALNNLNSYDMDGRTIKIDYGRSSKKSPPAEALLIKRYNVYARNLAWRVRSQDL